MPDVTRILEAVRQDGPGRIEDLLPVVYEELRILAAQKLASEKGGQTLQATALVHEAWLRLVGNSEEQTWENRGHFFAAAAQAMRRLLIENARRKSSLKRGGDRVRIPMEDIQIALDTEPPHLLAVHEALTRLEKSDPIKGRLVELRFFAGMSMREASEVLSLSPAQAKKHWAFAKAWLFREISRSSDFS